MQVLPGYVPAVGAKEAALSEYSPLPAALQAAATAASQWHKRLNASASGGATLEQFEWALSVSISGGYVNESPNHSGTSALALRLWVGPPWSSSSGPYRSALQVAIYMGSLSVTITQQFEWA